MTRRCLRQRGIMIYEMMLALSLLSTFAVGATYLFRSSLRVTAHADESVERASRFDDAIGQLRRDVWGAAKFEASDARMVRIERAGEPPITWSIDKAGTLIRASGADSDRREWRGVAEGVSFETRDAILVLVEPPDARGGEGRRLPFASQVILAKGAK